MSNTILLSLEGILRRVPHPDRHYRTRYYWEETWQTPTGKYVTGTIARAMRQDFVREFKRVYERCSREKN